MSITHSNPILLALAGDTCQTLQQPDFETSPQTRPMMDEFTVDALVNRDDPIPVVVLDHDLSEEGEGDGAQDRKRDRLKAHTSNMKENIRKKTADTGSSIQDRLLDK